MAGTKSNSATDATALGPVAHRPSSARRLCVQIRMEPRRCATAFSPVALAKIDRLSTSARFEDVRPSSQSVLRLAVSCPSFFLPLRAVSLLAVAHDPLARMDADQRTLASPTLYQGRLFPKVDEPSSGSAPSSPHSLATDPSSCPSSPSTPKTLSPQASVASTPLGSPFVVKTTSTRRCSVRSPRRQQEQAQEQEREQGQEQKREQTTTTTMPSRRPSSRIKPLILGLGLTAFSSRSTSPSSTPPDRVADKAVEGDAVADARDSALAALDGRRASNLQPTERAPFALRTHGLKIKPSSPRAARTSTGTLRDRRSAASHIPPLVLTNRTSPSSTGRPRPKSALPPGTGTDAATLAPSAKLWRSQVSFLLMDSPSSPDRPDADSSSPSVAIPGKTGLQRQGFGASYIDFSSPELLSYSDDDDEEEKDVGCGSDELWSPDPAMDSERVRSIASASPLPSLRRPAPSRRRTWHGFDPSA